MQETNDSRDGNWSALELWCAYPADLEDQEAARACAELLSGDECARWQSRRFERHQREFLATHALARMALSQHRATLPAEWRFALNVHGKPSVTPECGLRFNLSNAPELVVCLVNEGGEVGVDVEPLERAGKILRLADEVFSASEREQLAALDAEQRLDRAVTLWTLKEAYIKACGLGLKIPLRGISFLFDESSARLELDPALNDEAKRWRFCLLDHAGHRIAVMVEQQEARAIEIWEARPPNAQPVRVDAGALEWLPRA